MAQRWIKVRDRETGHEYEVTEERYKRTPKLWDRIGTEPPKPKTTVAAAAAKKKAQNQSGQEADSKQEES